MTIQEIMRKIGCLYAGYSYIVNSRRDDYFKFIWLMSDDVYTKLVDAIKGNFHLELIDDKTAYLFGIPIEICDGKDIIRLALED